MKNKSALLRMIVFVWSAMSCLPTKAKEPYNVDVLVVGGGASGVTAALQSARMGMRVLVTEESEWLGGMLTSSGVSAIDGNQRLPAGLWGEFRQRLCDYYGGMGALATGWVSFVQFEPSVGNRIFHEMLAEHSNITLWHGATAKNMRHKGGQWLVDIAKKGSGTYQVAAKVLIDATELGDVAKQCGVKYDVGMESRNQTHEDVAPLEANHIIQDITYVAILKDYGKDVSIKQPAGYNPNQFACACTNKWCVTPKESNRVWSKDKMITYGKLPNNKYMINWPIEGNDYYVNLIDLTPKQRMKALKAAKLHTMRFIYFLQHELGFNHLGLADDEYPTKDLLPFIPYHRESRRIHGLVRFTLNHMTNPYTQSRPLYRTSIAVGDYPVDHHHAQYTGAEQLPNLYFHPVPSFGLPLGTLIPQQTKGLIVAEKSISVSNIANGSTRLQPVVLQIGQAAGALAALSVRQQKDVAEVSVRDVQNVILKAKGYLMPFLDVEPTDIKFEPYQRIGATGILKGVGRSVDWQNETWLRADTLLLANELIGLADVYASCKNKVLAFKATPMTIQEAIDLIYNIAREEKLTIAVKPETVWQQFQLKDFDSTRNILRGEMAVLIDQMLHPFDTKPVSIEGHYMDGFRRIK